jgi:hypothetical protein
MEREPCPQVMLSQYVAGDLLGLPGRGLGPGVQEGMSAARTGRDFGPRVHRVAGARIVASVTTIPIVITPPSGPMEGGQGPRSVIRDPGRIKTSPLAPAHGSG